MPEYEVALAVYAAGTRKAAELMADGEPDPLMSPTVHNLQILQSGPETSMCHRRSTLRRIARGDPVFLCFCGITSFRQFKIGFDRELFIGEVRDEYVPLYDVALRSQAAALGALRPGVTAEEVHGAYAEVIREAGFEFSYRTGRGVGYSYLERPQLKFGDKTVLRPGMVLAVDGGCTVPGVFRGQVGDTVLVTETGYEFLTDYPRALESLVVA